MTALQVSTQKQLRSLVERIERMEAEKQARADDVKDIYLEAKGVGFDVKALRKIVALRKMDKAEREELEALITLYLGALEGTPLGDYGAKQLKGDGEETTISMNGGPHVPISVAKEALKQVKGKQRDTFKHEVAERLVDALGSK